LGIDVAFGRQGQQDTRRQIFLGLAVTVGLAPQSRQVLRSTISSPPQAAGSFFTLTYVHSSAAAADPALVAVAARPVFGDVRGGAVRAGGLIRNPFSTQRQIINTYLEIPKLELRKTKSELSEILSHTVCIVWVRLLFTAFGEEFSPCVGEGFGFFAHADNVGELGAVEGVDFYI